MQLLIFLRNIITILTIHLICSLYKYNIVIYLFSCLFVHRCISLYLHAVVSMENMFVLYSLFVYNGVSNEA